MSDIRFRCPACQGKLSIDARFALREVPCPLCKERITAWGSDVLDIRFGCPSCGQALVVDRAAAGSEKPCPACGRTLRVPDASRPAPAGVDDRAPAAGPPPAVSPARRSAGVLSLDEVNFLTRPPEAAGETDRPARDAKAEEARRF